MSIFTASTTERRNFQQRPVCLEIIQKVVFLQPVFKSSLWRFALSETQYSSNL